MLVVTEKVTLYIFRARAHFNSPGLLFLRAMHRFRRHLHFPDELGFCDEMTLISIVR